MGVYNRYHGNTGRCERVEEPRREPPPEPAPPPPPERRAPGPGPGLGGELGRLLAHLTPARLETEDLLLLTLLYLLYRECGDREFLIAMAAYLFF